MAPFAPSGLRIDYQRALPNWAESVLLPVRLARLKRSPTVTVRAKSQSDEERGTPLNTGNERAQE